MSVCISHSACSAGDLAAVPNVMQCIDYDLNYSCSFFILYFDVFQGLHLSTGSVCSGSGLKSIVDCRMALTYSPSFQLQVNCQLPHDTDWYGLRSGYFPNL